MPEITDKLKQLKPWHWAIVAVGGYFVYRQLHGKGSGSACADGSSPDSSGTCADGSIPGGLSTYYNPSNQGPIGEPGPPGPPGPPGKSCGPGEFENKLGSCICMPGYRRAGLHKCVPKKKKKGPPKKTQQSNVPNISPPHIPSRIQRLPIGRAIWPGTVNPTIGPVRR